MRVKQNKEGRGNKDFKKGGGQVQSSGGCLKKGRGWGGAGTPFQTMIIYDVI